MSLRSRIVGIVLGVALLAVPAQGQGLAKLDTALKDIPADAAYYAAWLRNQEQLDLFVKSKAVEKVLNQPTLGQLWGLIDVQLRQPGGPFDMWEQFKKDPENKQLAELMSDLLAHEIFLYGGGSWPDFVEVLVDVQGGRPGAQLTRALGAAQGKDATELMARHILLEMSKKPELLQVPEVVIGFKVRDGKAAVAQLGRLEKLLIAKADEVPEMKGRLKRQQVGGGDFLTLMLDGKLIPWDQVNIENYEEKPGEFKDLIKKLKTVTLTVSLGARGNYVLLALGAGTEPLAKLGQGPRLIDRPELQMLARHADQRLTSISYVSQAMMTKMGGGQKDIDDLVSAAEEALKLADLKPDQIARVKKDLEGIAKELKAYLPVPGAMSGVGYLNGRGIESYTYDWSKYPTADAAKPLTLLNHVGGSPLLAVAGRSKTSPDEWTKFVRWVSIAYGYFEEFGLPRMTAKEQDQYKEAKKVFLPLLLRFNVTMTTLIIPALADGQNGFVLDGKLASKKWHESFPESDKPLPILEPALLLGVSDADKLVKGGAELRQIFNDMYAAIRKLAKDEDIPEFQIPAPKDAKLKVGTGYTWPIRKEAGLDPKLAPSVGVGDKVAVIALSVDHLDRLMVPSPLKLSGGPLGNTKQPLSLAVYFSWSGTIDTLRPWIDFGLAQAPQVPAQEIHAVLDLLACFKSFASASYAEGPVNITHTESIFEDVK